MLDIIITLIVLFFCFWAFSLAPFVPMFKKDLKRINELSCIKKDDIFVEIWCGSAKVSCYIAKNNKDSKVIWIEINPLLYFYSKIKVYILWYKNLNIILWNALNYDYTNASIVYIFWLPETVSGKIKDKIYNEIKKWWKYISYTFEVKNWNWEIKKYNVEKQVNIYVCTK